MILDAGAMTPIQKTLMLLIDVGFLALDNFLKKHFGYFLTGFHFKCNNYLSPSESCMLWVIFWKEIKVVQHICSPLAYVIRPWRTEYWPLLKCLCCLMIMTWSYL